MSGRAAPESKTELARYLTFLSEAQKAWLSFFPDMTRRAQQHIAAYLCVRHRTGCQFGELSGYVKQNFLLDEATVKERLRAVIAEDLVTIEPESLSSRTIVLPTPAFLERYDRFLLTIGQLLGEAAKISVRGVLHQAEGLTQPQRIALAACMDCHIDPFRQAVDQICTDRALSRARALEARRSLLSVSHWMLILLVLEVALVPREAGPPDILADDLAASLLGLTRQNFQTTRDHTNYLISIGIFERRGGKTLHVGLSNSAAQIFQTALRQSGEALTQLASTVMAGHPTSDMTVELPSAQLSSPEAVTSGRIAHSLIVTGPEGVSWNVDLQTGTTIIGRTLPSDVVLPGNKVSRNHCKIEIAPDRVMLMDLGSTNRTFLEGREVQGEQRLSAGARIGIGDYVVIYQAIPAGKIQPRRAK